VTSDGHSNSTARKLTTNTTDIDHMRNLKSTTTKSLQELALLHDGNIFLEMMVNYAYIQVELRYYPLSDADRLLSAARRTTELFGQVKRLNLLTHHFAGLSGHVLLQLCDFFDTRDEAIGILDKLIDSFGAFIDDSTALTYDAFVHASLVRQRSRFAPSTNNAADDPLVASEALEHLATAAVSVTVGSGDDNGEHHVQQDDEEEGEEEAQAVAAAAAIEAAEALGANAAESVTADTTMDSLSGDGGIAAAAKAAALAAQAQMAAPKKFSGEAMSQTGYLIDLLHGH